MIPRCVRSLLHAVSAVGIAAIFLCSAGAHAQAFFQPLGASGSQSQTLPAGTTPLGVAVADFNHDGYPDMVVGNKAANTIDVYLSNGTGGFQAPATYPTCGGPTAALAQDLDLTGLPDIVITCNTPSSNVIEVFLNLGNGTFNPVPDGITNIVLGTGMGPVAITSGDFNNDGHPDLAVANSIGGSVTLFLSNPANNFTYYTVDTISDLGTPAGIATGRFTSSGNLDLAVSDSSTGTAHILTGDGTGSFSSGSSTTVGTDPTGLAVGDFNHDGNIDLAVVNAGSGTVSYLQGAGNATFTQPFAPISIGPATGTGSSYLLAVDINGDGNLDLVVGDTLQNDFSVLLGRSSGHFRAAEQIALPNGPAFVTTGDFNRDGKPDIAVTQSTGATVSVLINNTLATPVHGSLNYVAPHTLTNGHGNMADGVAVADFNHDGNPDIAATYLEDNSVRVLTGKGNGNFNAAAVYPVGNQPYWVASGDLNNDGYADLVTANTTLNSATGTISVLINKADGSGTFAAAQSYTVGNLPYQVAIGDLNGDGIPDLAVTNYGDNTVSILYGQTGGGFIGGQTLATCTNPYGVAIGDTRHTGQNDIAVTCFHTAQLEVFLNNSMMPFTPPPAQASFQSPEIYSTDVDPTSVVIADFNRNLDIVTGNSTANDVSFFGGNGNGSFKTAVNSFSLNFPDSIAVGDVNGDGIPDLVTVAANFNQVAILLGKGDGSFLQRVEFDSGQQPWAVALADFNLDGKLDIVTANTVNRVNITIPAYQTRYMNEFPPTPRGGPSLNVLLNGSGTTIALTSPTGTVAPGTPVTLTATVAPSLATSTTTPTGTVTFEDSDGTVLGSGPVTLSGGTASLTVPNLGSGRHVIAVLYSGDILYQPNTGTGAGFVVTVSGTPVVATAPSTVVTGATLSYSVLVGTVGPGAAPIGTITVFAMLPNGTLEQIDGPHAVTSNGNGTSSYSGMVLANAPPGIYQAYAVFTPTAPGSQAGSSNILTVTITP
jgi:hypothetical protein